jgi:Leucine-rich repeat (LRR) protein
MMLDSTKTRRHLFRFRLRTLLLTWLGMGAWLGWWVHSVREQRAAIAHIHNLTDRVYIDYSYQRLYDDPLSWRPRSDPTGASWVPPFVLKRVGQDYFHNVVSINVFQGTSGKELELAGELARLRNLEQLVLLYIDTTDAMVARICELRQLTGLELSDEKLTDDTLRMISGLPRLQLLEIGGEFTDAGVAHLERLTTLKHLELDSEHITDQGLAHIGRLHDLQLLCLSSTQLTEKGFAKLAASPKLSYLSLRHSEISDDDLRGVAELTSLEGLDLTGAWIKDAGVEHLSRLMNLRRLYLTNTHVTDDAMPHLVKLTKLEEITLDGTQVTDDAIAFLAQLPNLREIELENTRVTVAGLEQFKTAPKLRELRVPKHQDGLLFGLFNPVRERSGLTSSDMNRLQKALPQCKVTY